MTTYNRCMKKRDTVYNLLHLNKNLPYSHVGGGFVETGLLENGSKTLKTLALPFLKVTVSTEGSSTKLTVEVFSFGRLLLKVKLAIYLVPEGTESYLSRKAIWRTSPVIAL